MTTNSSARVTFDTLLLRETLTEHLGFNELQWKRLVEAIRPAIVDQFQLDEYEDSDASPLPSA